MSHTCKILIGNSFIYIVANVRQNFQELLCLSMNGNKNVPNTHPGEIRILSHDQQ